MHRLYEGLALFVFDSGVDVHLLPVAAPQSYPVPPSPEPVVPCHLEVSLHLEFNKSEAGFQL